MKCTVTVSTVPFLECTQTLKVWFLLFCHSANSASIPSNTSATEVKVKEFFPLLFRTSHSYRGPGSSVDIATGYGLDGPGIDSRLGRNFPHLSRPALGPTQPPVQCVPGLSRGKVRPGRDADPSPTPSAVVMKV
jgi:hypothetical protein